MVTELSSDRKVLDLLTRKKRKIDADQKRNQEEGRKEITTIRKTDAY